MIAPRHLPPASGLSPEQIAQLRADLQRTLARLERGVTSNGHAARPAELDQTAVGRLSRIEALMNQRMTRGLADREQLQLTQVATALSRIDEGVYGTCTTCGAPIPFERLLVFPETLTCTRCGVGQ